MQVDPKEIKVFEEALLQSEEALINMIQAGRRFLLILSPPRSFPPKIPSPTGEFCKCGGPLVRTGTCLTCQLCGWSKGCG